MDDLTYFVRNEEGTRQVPSMAHAIRVSLQECGREFLALFQLKDGKAILGKVVRLEHSGETDLPPMVILNGCSCHPDGGHTFPADNVEQMMIVYYDDSGERQGYAAAEERVKEALRQGEEFEQILEELKSFMPKGAGDGEVAGA